MVQAVATVDDFARIAQYFSHRQGRLGFARTGWTYNVMYAKSHAIDM